MKVWVHGDGRSKQHCYPAAVWSVPAEERSNAPEINPARARVLERGGGGAASLEQRHLNGVLEGPRRRFVHTLHQPTHT